MWIKVLLCIQEADYARRLSSFYNKEYRDKIEINIVENMEQAISFSKDNGIDIALFDSVYESAMINAVEKKEMACFCAILADRLYESNDNIIRIQKYQRADNLYKEILDTYANHGKVKVSRRTSVGGSCKVYTFISPKGGSGTTTVAKAYARKRAFYEKVLYINLQPMVTPIQSEVREGGMDDIIMALKSRRNILGIKLQSAVSKGVDQVEYFEASTNPMDMMDLTKDDMVNLINGVRELNVYQKVIFDLGDNITSREVELMKQADFNVCVVDNEESCLSKFERLYKLLEAVGQREKVQLLRKTEIFKNKWVRGLETLYEDYSVVKSGWAPLITDRNNEGVIERIAYSDSFDNLGIEHAE